MNKYSENAAGTKGFAEQGEADCTLRLIARLPVPQGLEDRVKTALHEMPAGRTAKLLEWQVGNWTGSAWTRGAAAAAIVIVVAGGSWGVYSRVQRHEAPIAIPRVGEAGGFSSANAVRTPKTLDMPTVRPRASEQSAPVKKPAGGKKKARPRERSGAVQLER